MPQIGSDIYTPVPGGSFTSWVQNQIHRSRQTDTPFYILVLQLANLEYLEKRQSPAVSYQLLRELQAKFRRLLHPSQFVGIIKGGIGFGFVGSDSGKVDYIARKLALLSQQTIREGHYNDITSRWTDILYNFIHPKSLSPITTKIGWAIYPRDGAGPADLMKRGFYHALRET